MINREQVRAKLQQFDFKSLFIEQMGWAKPSDGRATPIQIEGVTYSRQAIGQLSGIIVFEITPSGNTAHQMPDAKTRRKLYDETEKIAAENLLIFLDDDKERSQSVWYWVKRDKNKKYPREHYYFKGQPSDLFLSKLDSLVVELDELRPDGTLPITDANRKLTGALDVERVTKRFYTEFSDLRDKFTLTIEGIDHEADRNWYASVLLNRLMFVYFLQKQSFIQGNTLYLEAMLEASQQRGPDRFYREFLTALFFEGFAKPNPSPEAAALLGPIKYLNGGLFLKHTLEEKYPAIRIADAAFDHVLKLFGHYSWHLDDTPGTMSNEINPDVLGYIFEKYINQKAFGAYYTRTEITSYLCERTIHAAILDKLHAQTERRFETLGDALLRLDVDLCRRLLNDILPKLSILDPACGSGAFLVAAMKTLLDVYGAIIGRITVLNDANLNLYLAEMRKHPSQAYFIRKRIITDNLYGVDIMQEATEIARLRLFLALVASVNKGDDLEPLPNIDFNIMPGNSLIGLLSVDESRFERENAKRALPTGDSKQQSFIAQEEQKDFLGILQAERAKKYRQLLTEKNLKIAAYRGATSYDTDLHGLRDQIDTLKRDHYAALNGLLLEDFTALGVKYEAAQANGKTIKRPLIASDIAALAPFHWGYEFDEIIGTRGGFDAILTNPPWEIFKPQAKEFFAEYSDIVTKNKMDIKAFEVEQERLLIDPETQAAWLEYQSRFPILSAYFRSAPQYKNQIAVVNGKKAGTDINLYKLFTEQCYNLIRTGGLCGTIIPSGIYTDLGTKQLREMLFSQSRLKSLYGFSNEKFIFEGVHHGFKITLLVFEKGGQTVDFEAAFRINTREAVAADKLEQFLHSPVEHIMVSVPLVRRLSPDSLSIMEFKGDLDVTIAEKMLKFPLLGETVPGKWKLSLTREFDMTNDSHLFHKERQPGMLPLYEGKMVHQFTHRWTGAQTRYWVDEKAGRKAVLGSRGKDMGQRLDYQAYRLAYRSIASNTNERTLICGVIPPAFTGNSLNVAENLNPSTLMFCVGILNSFVIDWLLRQKVTTNINMFYMYQLPVPRYCPGDPYFASLVNRAARLICTTPEYDDLAKEVGLGEHKAGVTDGVGRARLRAEIDGIVAHLYGLSELEFVHILGTFPLVPEPIKMAAQNAYRLVAQGVITV